MAAKASDAFSIIDHRHIITHDYSIHRADLGAMTAFYAQGRYPGIDLNKPHGNGV